MFVANAPIFVPEAWNLNPASLMCPSVNMYPLYLLFSFTTSR